MCRKVLKQRLRLWLRQRVRYAVCFSGGKFIRRRGGGAYLFSYDLGNHNCISNNQLLYSDAGFEFGTGSCCFVGGYAVILFHIILD